MHLSDGIINGDVCLAGYVVSVLITTYSLKKIPAEDTPKIAVVTAAFFIASLIHIKIGPSSVHLVLNGLVGILLGIAAFPSIFVGLLLQAIVFGHGGITTLGVNSIIMGTPAMLSYFLFNVTKHYNHKTITLSLSFICGALSIFLAALLMAFFLIFSEKEFINVAKLIVIAHIPVMIIEGIICLLTVSFLLKVKPELLE
jgi:cobalt/nickel transport system permease protein